VNPGRCAGLLSRWSSGQVLVEHFLIYARELWPAKMTKYSFLIHSHVTGLCFNMVAEMISQNQKQK
jgi:hypothetical protein